MTCLRPCVSVVVPTYRRNDLLRRCLAALAGQDFDRADYEVIVVDDAASDETRALVDGWARDQGNGWAQARATEVVTANDNDFSRPDGRVGPQGVLREARTTGVVTANRATNLIEMPGGVVLVAPNQHGSEVDNRYAGTRAPVNVRYLPVHGSGHGPAAARNLGWRAAAGEIVAFTDDDCIPTPGWLRAGCEAFTEGVIGVSGRVIVPLAGTPTDYELDATGLERSEFVTANCFYRRDALAAIGGFDERFAIAWREDTDLLFTLLSRERTLPGSVAQTPPGGRFRRVPSALVIHPIRPAPRWVSLRQQRKNFYNALLYKKHPVLYRARLGGRTPWRYYAIVAALIGTPVALALHQEPAALGAALLWLALTARFCGRRLAATSHAAGHVAEMAATSALIPPLAVFWRLAGAVTYRVWFL